MSRTIAFRIAAVLLGTVSAQAASAAQATQEGADALKAVFERYVGRAAAGQPGSVTVLAQGTAYQASLDLHRMTQGFERFGFTVDPAVAALMLTPQDDGTWRVTADTFPQLVMHIGPQTLTTGQAAYKFEGTFDPKIPGFADSTTTQTGSTMKQSAPNVLQERRFDTVRSTQKGAPAANGSAGVEVHYAATGLANTMTATPPGADAAAAPQPSTAFGYTAANAGADVAIDQLRMRDLLDVWAFFVAHPDRDGIVAGQDELKGLLRKTLPLMAALKESGSVDQMSVTTPLGPFSAKKFGGAVDLTNLAAIGEAALGLSVDGLAVPTGDLPPWSLGLIPKSVDLHPSVSGFHLADALREMVEDFDLKAEGLTPAQKEKIGHLLMPGDGAKVALGPSRITSDLLDLRMEGDGIVGGAAPSGHLKVTGVGLDKAIAVLQAAAAGDEVAGQVLGQFAAAKTLAKPNGENSYTWDFEAAPGGSLTVNGVPMK